MTDISIIIPIRNEERYIEGLIKCLNDMYIDKYPTEVIFIDGDSDDNTNKILQKESRKLIFDFKIIKNKLKSTPTSLNLGIENSVGKYIIRLDGHSLYPNNYIKKLMYIHENYKCDNCGGILETIPFNKKDLKSTVIANALSSIFCVGNSKFRIIKNKNSIIEVSGVPFGCFKRNIFKKIGKFDEELIRNQDDEFDTRIIKFGGKILMDTSLRIHYYGRKSFKQIFKMFFQYGFYKPIAAFKLKKIYTFRQLVPLTFLFFLLILISLSFINLSFLIIFISLSIFYVTLAIVFSIKSYKNNYGNKFNLFKYCFYFLITSFTIHSSYGLGYAKGLLKILNSSKLPKYLEISR